MHTRRTITMGLALLAAATLGACGTGKANRENATDSGDMTGTGSAGGTSIGQTPGYGAPGAGGALSDTMGGGPLPPSGGVSSPAAGTAQAGQRDTVGGGTARTDSARPSGGAARPPSP